MKNTVAKRTIEGGWKMIIDCRYIIKVKDYMPTVLPRPRLKRTVLVTGWGEWLPIITEECET